ncbi:MAG: hypothetical protein ACI4W7_06640 [Candidatus Spyradenecus sp.]
MITWFTRIAAAAALLLVAGCCTPAQEQEVCFRFAAVTITPQSSDLYTTNDEALAKEILDCPWRSSEKVNLYLRDEVGDWLGEYDEVTGWAPRCHRVEAITDEQDFFNLSYEELTSNLHYMWRFRREHGEMSPELLCMTTFWLDTRGEQVFIKSAYYYFTLNEEKQVDFYLISTAYRETLRLSERE